MCTGYILINIEPGHEHEVFNMLTKINGISQSYQLFGEYDIIVKIEANDFCEIEETILSKIKAIEGIIKTKTMNVAPITE